MDPLTSRPQSGPGTPGPATGLLPRIVARLSATGRSAAGGIVGRIVLIAVAAALPMAMVMLNAFIAGRDTAVARAVDELERVVRAEAVNLQARFAALAQLLTAVAQSSAPQAPKEQCSARLAEIYGRAPSFVNLFVVEASGEIDCSAVPLERPINAGDREYFKRAMRSSEPVYGEIVVSRRTGRPILPMALAIDGKSGNKLGVVATAIDIGTFLEHVSDKLPYAGTVLALWSNSGQLLSRLPHLEEVAGKSPANSSLFRAILRDGARVARAEAVGLDGVLRVYGVAGLSYGNERLWLTAGAPRSEVVRDIDASFARNLTILVASFGLMLAIAVAMGHYAVRKPIAKLSHAAVQLARGEHIAALRMTSGAGELVDLGANFDLMAERLQAQIDTQARTNVELIAAKANVEVQIKARTQELETVGQEATARGDALAQTMEMLAILSETSDLIQTADNLESALPLVDAAARRLFPENAGAIYLFRESRNLLEMTSGWGDLAAAPSFSPQECLAIRLGQAYRVDPGESKPRCQHVEWGVPGYTCIPMQAEGNISGVLTCSLVAPDKSVNSAVVRLARMAVERFALAIANLQLRQRLRDIAVRDSLTGLYNRRFAEDLLAREFGRADREATTLCVMMLDIDHFKSFNDNYGHDVGDRLLESVGSLLLSSFRGSDVCCRYGGEEFLVVLPNTTLAGATKRAEKLRGDMKKITFHYKGAPIGGVSCSIGLASYPDPVADAQTLVGAADTALYEAKAAGRDRVRVVGVPAGTGAVGEGEPAALPDDGKVKAA